MASRSLTRSFGAGRMHSKTGVSSLSIPRILFRSRTTRPQGEAPTRYNPDLPLKEQDKLLYTPGPLTTSYSVKKAMMHDLGSRDKSFINVIKQISFDLLNLAHVTAEDFCLIPMQGSGTFGVEAVLSSVISKKNGGVLIITNGAYGLRMKEIAKAHSIHHVALDFPENSLPDLSLVESTLKEHGNKLTHVAIVHSETSSGVINDIQAVGQIAQKYEKSYIVDAMSSFGAYPIDLNKLLIDYLITSANKCLEGIPGLSLIFARNKALEASKGNADTLSLDIHKQRDYMKTSGQFRFTPPVHAILALDQAITELRMEGGVVGRAKRYKENQRLTNETMIDELKFKPYLEPEIQGHIISAYRYPKDPNWNFETFYNLLHEKGFVIYPGKVSNADCFRIGHIGRISPDDTRKFCRALTQVCNQMKTSGAYKPSKEKSKTTKQKEQSDPKQQPALFPSSQTTPTQIEKL